MKEKCVMKLSMLMCISQLKKLALTRINLNDILIILNIIIQIVLGIFLPNC